MNENQLKFLYDNYGKSQGFADYNEFKGLMENDANRKLFFDASNKDLGFTDYNEFETLLGVKKKGGTQPVSGQPVQQPGQPSAPSFGQKITEKIATSATQIPLKTTLQKEQEESKMAGEIVSGFAKGVQQKEQERKQAYEQGGYAYEQFKQKEEAKKQVVAKAKEEESKNKKASEFKGYVREKDVFQMPTPGESQNYSYDFTKTYIDYLSQSDPDRADFVRDKYFTLKAKDKAERDSEDEKFLRQIESEALDITYRAKSQELDLTIAAIDKLQKKATPSDKGALDYLYKQYESTKNSLKGITAAYDQNKLQYGKIAGSELQAEEEKLARFRELQEGGTIPVATEFFKGIGNAVTNGVINLYQIPKVMGDLVGDTDYDWADQMYDSVSGAKRELDKDFGTPLPQGMKMSDLPTTARLAVVGGNAIGSVGLFATGGAIGGTTRLGQAAATFGTSFLTTESDYYQEALDAGMSAQDAAFSATYLAAQTALVESIIPDVKYFQPSAFRKSVIQGLSSGVRAGLPIKEAAKMAFKNTMQAIPQSAGSLAKAGTKEAGEEVLGQAAEDVGKEVINASAQKEYFNDTFNPEAYTDAILGGFIAGGGLSVFSRPNSKSPTQQEVMREIVDRRDLLTRPGTASDKIAGKEDLRDFNEATEVFDAMSPHSAWKDMPREKQNQAFALAQQAELMKKEQERMKKLRIPDEQKDAEIKRLEDEVNMMFAEQLEQQKQAIYDQENIQGIPGQIGVGQELVQGQPIQVAGQEATTAGGVLQAQREEIEKRRQEELNEIPLVPQAFDNSGKKEPIMVQREKEAEALKKEINAKYDAELAALEAQPTIEAAPTRISEINNLEQALFENEVSQNETGAGTLSEQQLTDITAKLDEMRGQNKEGGLNEIETLMKQALGENLITAADIDQMVEDGSVEIKCPPGAKKAEHGMRMGFIPGGKWDIVTEFKGKSHENGGIDIEITGGKINYTSKEPNLKAKKGGFWKTLKDIGLGIVDTQLSTIGNVAGIKSMQDIIDEDQYENDKFDEAGNFVGKLAGTALKVIPVTAPIASAVGMAGGAINQVAGIDERYYDPSKHTSKLSQAGDIISAVGTVAGMAVNAGTAANASKTFAAGDKLSSAQKMSMRMGGINKTLGQVTKGVNMFGGAGGAQQQPQQFLQQTQSNPAMLPQQTMANPYQQQQYGIPAQQAYSNSRSGVVTINGVNYAPDQYGNLVPVN